MAGRFFYVKSGRFFYVKPAGSVTLLWFCWYFGVASFPGNALLACMPAEDA